MEYIVYAVVIILALLFVLLPFIRGASSAKYFQETDKAKKSKADKEQNIKDDIESTKLALRDLDMENKIGKISNDDYEVLKDELLDEWKSAEDEYKQMKNK
jgi:sortase (surface protein transpeptidase)